MRPSTRKNALVMGAGTNDLSDSGLTRRRLLKRSGLAGGALLLPGLWDLSSARAAGGTVTVSCGRRLGAASQIHDFLGAGGELEAVAGNPSHAVVRAWRRLGMRHVSFEQLHAEEGSARLLGIERGRGGALRIDFGTWDDYLQGAQTNLRARPFLHLGNMPRALSSRPEGDDYFRYRPRDLGEWERFIARVVSHNVDKLGLRGLYYAAQGEPDHPDTWSGSGSRDPAQTLREHVELYAATYRAVKSADRRAQVGGPATMNWCKTRLTGSAAFDLADWVRELAAFNAAAGSAAVGLDFISWQDYAWSSRRISDGADAVAGFLAQHGFDPATPKLLGGSGWGSWSTDYLGASRAYQRASHAAHNIIREFKDPGQRRFALALYYHFLYRNVWYPPGDEEGRVLKTTGMVVLPRRGRLQLTPIYAAFQMAKAMARGEIVETTSTGELEAMACRDDRVPSVVAAVNNHTSDAARASVDVRDLPFLSSRAWVGVQRIDAQHSVLGRGLDPPSWHKRSVTRRRLTLSLQLAPHATAQISIYPAKGN